MVLMSCKLDPYPPTLWDLAVKACQDFKAVFLALPLISCLTLAKTLLSLPHFPSLYGRDEV